MKLYIYKNGLCDPARNVGVARKFETAGQIDEYIDFFCASIDPRFLGNWRIFITNDEVDWAEVDNMVLMDEAITIKAGTKIEEIDVRVRSLAVNDKLQEMEKKRALAKAKAEKNFKPKDIEPYTSEPKD